MTKLIEDNLARIPVVNLLVRLGKKIKIPGLEGLSLYDVVEIYFIGIVRGALTTRAGGKDGLPPQTFNAVKTVIDDIINNQYGGLLSLGFLLSMFLMTNGINAIFGGLNCYSNISNFISNSFSQNR